jgi:hypothetical protein
VWMKLWHYAASRLTQLSKFGNRTVGSYNNHATRQLPARSSVIDHL